jgi:broad specificity phosphatase PhoE
MSTRLTLICHGPTRATRMAAFPGDESLEADIAEKAAAMADHLGRHRRAWTAPERRARETSAALALAASVNEALRDWDYGRWSGRSLAEVVREEPETVAAWRSNPSAAPHGGETLDEVCRRVAEWLDEPTRLGGRTIAVTHVAVIKAAVLHVLGAPLSAFWHIDVEPLSVIDLRSNGSRWNLRFGAGR